MTEVLHHWIPKHEDWPEGWYCICGKRFDSEEELILHDRPARDTPTPTVVDTSP